MSLSVWLTLTTAVEIFLDLFFITLLLGNSRDLMVLDPDPLSLSGPGLLLY